MGSRWMQQKEAKIRKQRRAHLKPYNLHMRNTKLPNKDVLGEYKERGLALGVDHSYNDSLIKVIWGITVPQNNNEPRQEAKRRIEELREAPTKEFFIRLNGPNKFKSFGVFFGEGNGPAYFVEIDLRLKTVKKSKVYKNLHAARAVYQMEQITWTSLEELPPAPS